MGYRFSDFIGDVVKPTTEVFTSPFQSIFQTGASTISSLGQSLSLPLLIGGAAVLLIVLKK